MTYKTTAWERVVAALTETRAPLSTLKPGESRIIENKPCPPERYVHPNEYWLLRRAARRLMYNHVEDMWKDPKYGQEILKAVQVLRDCADQIPSRPCRSWEQYGLGLVQEICCPACRTLFTVQGKFYTPQCTNCKRYLHEKR